MAFGAPTFADIGGAASDIFGGMTTASSLRLKAQGDLAEAGNYDLAAGLAKQNEQFTEQSTAIKEVQAQRSIYQGLGAEKADIAGAGFLTGSGSAGDLLRSGAQQGALTKAVMGQQGLITEAGFNEQAASYTSMATAARYAAQVEQDQASKSSLFGDITGAIKGVAAFATLF